VVLIAGLVWTAWGLARLRSLAFALGLLATMVPPPAIVYNAAAAPLQLFASRIASDLAQLLGVQAGIRHGLLSRLFRMVGLCRGFWPALAGREICLPVHRGALMNGSLRRGFPYHLAGAFLLLAATLAGSRLTSYRKSQPLLKPLDTIARHIQDFDGTDNPPLDETVLKELKPTSYLGRTYRKPGAAIDLFIAFYAQQRAGQSMHSPKHCLPGSGWEIWDYITPPSKFRLPTAESRSTNTPSVARPNDGWSCIGISPNTGSSPASIWESFCWLATPSCKTAPPHRSCVSLFPMSPGLWTMSGLSLPLSYLRWSSASVADEIIVF
jgi:Protein of unknown function (DUF3485)/Transmembrane exosortase (Exosortase_EpsH)